MTPKNNSVSNCFKFSKILKSILAFLVQQNLHEYGVLPHFVGISRINYVVHKEGLQKEHFFEYLKFLNLVKLLLKEVWKETNCHCVQICVLECVKMTSIFIEIYRKFFKLTFGLMCIFKHIICMSTICDFYKKLFVRLYCQVSVLLISRIRITNNHYRSTKNLGIM